MIKGHKLIPDTYSYGNASASIRIWRDVYFQVYSRNQQIQLSKKSWDVTTRSRFLRCFAPPSLSVWCAAVKLSLSVPSSLFVFSVQDMVVVCYIQIGGQCPRSVVVLGMLAVSLLSVGVASVLARGVAAVAFLFFIVFLFFVVSDRRLWVVSDVDCFVVICFENPEGVWFYKPERAVGN